MLIFIDVSLKILVKFLDPYAIYLLRMYLLSLIIHVLWHLKTKAIVDIVTHHSSPIIQPPNWSLPFELMCDASDYAVGAVLG